ncbi:TPA: hypothetical protein ACF35M_004815, partial [Vibrio parahaemolyticus]
DEGDYMSKEIKKKIRILKQCRNKVNPLSVSNDEGTLGLLKELRDDGLIALDPPHNINTSAKVRLTDKGEEHLDKLVSNKPSDKFKWLVAGIMGTGIITYIVRIYT